MIILTNKQYRELTGKIDELLVVFRKVNKLIDRQQKAALPGKPRPSKPELAVHNNGHKKHRWHKRKGGGISTQDAVMSLMRDGVARNIDTMVREINAKGDSRVVLKAARMGAVLTKMTAAKKIERIGRGIYRIKGAA